jgi:hypothetical protein
MPEDGRCVCAVGHRVPRRTFALRIDCGFVGLQREVPKASSARMCETVQSHPGHCCYAVGMSARNGDRARFHKDRKRKLHRRQRLQALMATLKKRGGDEASSRVASHNMQDEGGPVRIGD